MRTPTSFSHFATSAEGDETSSKREFENVNELTLPNSFKPGSDSSVMWHGPDSKGSGARSAVPSSGVPASAVTDRGEPSAGAAIAGTPHVRAAGQGVQRKNDFDATFSSLNDDETESTSTSEMFSLEAWRTGILELGHHTFWPEDKHDSIQRGFTVVRLARDLTRFNRATRSRRKDTKPSEATLIDYAKKCAQIDLELEQFEDEPEALIQVMGRHARSKNSFYLYKAALKARQMKRIQDLLRSQDASQRLGGTNETWLRHVHELQKAMKAFADFDELHRQSCLDLVGGRGVRSRSKRRDLPNLPDDWRTRFLEITSDHEQYADAAVLLRFCGLRPTELCKGVDVSFSTKGIEVRILGGKTRKTAGQPWRVFRLNTALLPKSFVDRVERAGKIKVAAEPDALRMYLRRISAQVFRPVDAKQAKSRNQEHVLSAYTFRHALVTDLRDEGWEAASIAAVIGEASADTVAYYGIRSGGRGKSPSSSAVLMDSVQAARSVRPSKMEGLDALLAQKESAIVRSRVEQMTR